ADDVRRAGEDGDRRLRRGLRDDRDQVEPEAVAQVHVEDGEGERSLGELRRGLGEARRLDDAPARLLEERREGQPVRLVLVDEEDLAARAQAFPPAASRTTTQAPLVVGASSALPPARAAIRWTVTRPRPRRPRVECHGTNGRESPAKPGPSSATSSR